MPFYYLKKKDKLQAKILDKDIKGKLKPKWTKLNCE